MRLPELQAGVYRHYKGRHYLVLGYSHDSNADTLYDQQAVDDAAGAWQSGVMHTIQPLGERVCVVYIGLELTDAHKGPRIGHRNVTGPDAFFDWLHPDDWSVCPEPVPYGVGNPIECDCSHAGFTLLVRRFTYVGPEWKGF
jgi:hypothetical protein